MNLLSVRIITADVKRLVQFYEQITGLSVQQYTDDFAELQTRSATLAIGSTLPYSYSGVTRSPGPPTITQPLSNFG